MPSRKPVKAVHTEQADLQGVLGMREGNWIFARKNGTPWIGGATRVEERKKLEDLQNMKCSKSQDERNCMDPNICSRSKDGVR